MGFGLTGGSYGAYQYCHKCQEIVQKWQEDDGQPSEQQEWHDFDRDCWQHQMGNQMQKWGVWKSVLGGVILRCPLGQLTIRTPWSDGLFSERDRKAWFGWRFVWRRLGWH
jgi:hypothetical protein